MEASRSRLWIDRPPPVMDMVHLYAPGGRIKRVAHKAALAQWTQSNTTGFRERDSNLLVAAAGAWPVQPGLLELWFVCRPEAAAHVLAIIRHARLILPKLTQDGTTILARVAIGHRSGRRLAQLAGFERVGVDGGDDLWMVPRGEKRGTRDRDVSRGEKRGTRDRDVSRGEEGRSPDRERKK